MKRNILAIGYRLLVIGCCLSLASCNLFIDDEYESLEIDDVQVPVHTGEGYDKPVTVVENGCTVTYQYKSNVRVVSQEEQDRYIVYTEKDELGGFIEIHYRADTPKDLLPVPGEILMSGATERFPWGCNHQVLNRFREGDVYIMVAGFSPLVDTFEELDITGDAVFQDTRCVTRSGSDDRFAWEKTQNTTRADDDEGISVGFGDKSGLTDDGLVLVTEFSGRKHLNIGSIIGEIAVSGTYISITSQLSFDDFSIRNKSFKCKYTETVEEKLEMKLTGGWKGNIASDTKQIGSKVMCFGPVIVVFFAELYYSLDLTFSISRVLKEHYKTKTTYWIDFNEMTMKKEVRKLIDEPMNLKEKMVEAALSFEFGLSLGIGIFGKVISARLLVGPAASVTATIPYDTELYAGKAKNLSAVPRLTVAVNIELTLGVFIDLSLKALIGGFASDTQMKKLEEFEKNISRDNSWYQTMLEVETDFWDEKSKHLSPKEKAKQKILGCDIGASHTWIFPVTSKEWSWYPSIKDDGFSVEALWDEKNERYNFVAELPINQAGLLSEYVPCLMLVDRKKEKSSPKFVWPIEGGSNCKVEDGKTYHFNLKDLGDDIVYNVYPSYFEYPVPNFPDCPEALDKAKICCLTSPKLSVNKVEPVNFKITKDPEGFTDQYYDKDEKKYEYEYKWLVNTYATVQGMYYMKNWWIDEQNNREEHNRQTKADLDLAELDKVKDGYEMFWTFLKYSHSYDEHKQLDLSFEPCYTLKNDRYEKFHYGKAVDCTLKGNEMKSRAADYSYAPQSRWGGSATGRQTVMTTANGDKVVRRLDAIKKGGQVVWQRQSYGM